MGPDSGMVYDGYLKLPDEVAILSASGCDPRPYQLSLCLGQCLIPHSMTKRIATQYPRHQTKAQLVL